MFKSSDRLAWYTIAPLAVSVAFLATWLLGPVMEQSTFLFFIFAVGFCGDNSGGRAGLLATLLSALLAAGIFFLPYYAISLKSVIPISIFIGVGVLISWLTGAGHQARKTLRETIKVKDESLALLESLLATSPVGIAFHDMEGRYVRVNPTLAAFNGLPVEKLLGHRLSDFIPEIGRKKEAQLKRVLETGEAIIGDEISGETLAAPGVLRHWVASYYPVRLPSGETVGTGILVAEITERRRKEQLIRLQASALEAAANAIVISDMAGGITWANSAFTSLTGYTREEALGQNPRILKSGEQDDAFYEEMWRTIRSGNVWHGELINRRKDGSHYVEEMTITPVMNEADTITNFIAVKQDVTARKQADAERLRLANHIQLLLDSTDEGIYGIDLNGNCTFINRAGAKLIDYPLDDVLGKNMHALVHHSHADGSPYEVEQCPIYKAFRHGASCRVDSEVMWRRDGTAFPAEYSSRPIIEDGQITGAVVSFVDIIARQRLEEQLRHSQKLEAIGQLAGGVAHDFNNLLTVIIGYSQMSLSLLADSHPARHQIEEVRRAGERAASLTSQLLAFSRRQVFQPKRLDLNATITDLQKMLCRLIGEDINLCTLLDPLGCHIESDPGQIQQVIMNLAVNARDAMPNGGQLTMQTAHAYLGAEKAAQIEELVPGHYAKLMIIDTGCGMDKETQSHIFEPFFTTKEQGKGTGLGLAMVYGIIKRSGGHILVDSQPGRGTSFTIYLPWAAQPAGLEESCSHVSETRGGKECVLLVEDDEAVKEIAARTLRGQGYKVWEARNAEEALSIVERYAFEEALLLVTDIVMPGMDGVELAERVNLLRPGTGVLFVSGYPERGVMKGKRLSMEQPYLCKPFTPTELLCKVRAVLDERSSLIA